MCHAEESQKSAQWSTRAPGSPYLKSVTYRCCVQVYVSYLEIYNEVGYDLLDPTREVQAMEDLPQASSLAARQQLSMAAQSCSMAAQSCSMAAAVAWQQLLREGGGLWGCICSCTATATSRLRLDTNLLSCIPLPTAGQHHGG